jgi:hypothetical protein
VVDRGFGDDRSVSDLPWASVFDPSSNTRALSAIQAEGFRAASQLVDRFVRAVEGGGGGLGNGVSPPSTGMFGIDGTQDLERFVRSWWGMFGQLLLGSTRGVTPATRTLASLTLRETDASGQVHLEVTKPASAEAEVWLHNNSFDDLCAVRLRCGELLSHSGFSIGTAAVRLEPQLVTMPARSSRGVRVCVDVTDDTRADVYRGTLLVDAHPDLWLPVVLTVRASAS